MKYVKCDYCGQRQEEANKCRYCGAEIDQNQQGAFSSGSGYGYWNGGYNWMRGIEYHEEPEEQPFFVPAPQSPPHVCFDFQDNEDAWYRHGGDERDFGERVCHALFAIACILRYPHLRQYAKYILSLCNMVVDKNFYVSLGSDGRLNIYTDSRDTCASMAVNESVVHHMQEWWKGA